MLYSPQAHGDDLGMVDFGAPQRFDRDESANVSLESADLIRIPASSGQSITFECQDGNIWENMGNMKSDFTMNYRVFSYMFNH